MRREFTASEAANVHVALEGQGDTMRRPRAWEERWYRTKSEEPQTGLYNENIVFIYNDINNKTKTQSSLCKTEQR